jgi:hypothetical protein
MIEKVLAEKLSLIDIQPKIDAKKYKMHFSITSSEQGEIT